MIGLEIKKKIKIKNKNKNTYSKLKKQNKINRFKY